MRGQAGFGWAALGWERETVVGSGSASNRVSAHSQNKIENPFSFSKSVYNLQTNLNFDNFYSQSKI
jgi:hypothetical protein